MKRALLLALLPLAACAGPTEAPSCRGEVFQLNPTRTVPLANLSGVIPASAARASDFR